MAYPTNPIYKLYKNFQTNVVTHVFLTKDGKEYSIPFDCEHRIHTACLQEVTKTPGKRMLILLRFLNILAIVSQLLDV